MIDFDLRKTLAAVVDAGRSEAAPKDVQLVYRMDDAVPSDLRGDEMHLKRALQLLVGRAVDVTPQGEVRLDVSLDERTGDELAVRFEVADNAESLEGELLVEERLFSVHEGGDANLALWRQVAPIVADELGIRCRPERGNTYWFTVRLGVGSAPHPRG